MSATGVPAIEGWFTTGDAPALLGTRCTTCANVVFPPSEGFCPNPGCRGREVETVELRAGRTSTLAWADTERGMWGYAVDGPDGGDPQALEPVLWQLVAQPAHVTDDAWQVADRAVSVSLLPQGAELAQDQLADGDIDAGVLAGRSLALAEARGEDLPVVHFRVGGHEYPLNDYVEDLFGLEMLDGTSMAVETVADAVWEMRDGSTEQLLRVSPADLVQEEALPAHDGTVLAATGWLPDARVLQDARVELRDEGSGADPLWVRPHDVAQVVGPGGVTFLSLDVPEGSTVLSVGLARGEDVERWEAPAVTVEATPRLGVGWAEVDGELVPTMDGERLQEVDIASWGEARLYAAPTSVDEDLLVLPPGLGVDDHVLPLLRKGDSLDPASWVLGDSRVVETTAGPVRVVETTAGMLTEGTLLAVRPGSAVDHGADIVWTLLGSEQSGHLVIEGGLVVQASGSAAGDPWLMYPVGDDSWGPTSTSVDVRAGLVGSSLVGLVHGSDPDVLHVAAVLPEGSGAELVLAPGARLVSSRTSVGPLEGLETVTATVDIETDTGTVIAPTDAVGLDLDGDGEADLRLPARG